MKLTTKNVMKFLENLGMPPCKEGMKALNKLLRQKKSMEYVFNRMKDMRRDEVEISYAQWMCNWLHHVTVVDCHSFPPSVTFKNFKRLFEKLPDMVG